MFGKEFILQMNFMDGMDELQARRMYGLVAAIEKFIEKHKQRHLENGDAD